MKPCFFFNIFLLTIFLQGCQQLPPSEDSIGNSISQENRVCFLKKCFDVELAKDQNEWQRGLQFRESLDLDSGMLFIFPQEWRYSFWMKDTLIPLDMIWLDENKRVVDITKEAQPCRNEFCVKYRPRESARYVLEVNAGVASEVELKVGDRARF